MDLEKPRPEPEAIRDVPERSDIRVGGSLHRCARCSEVIETTGTDWVSCRACLSRHHARCWTGCLGCGRNDPLTATPPSPRSPWRSASVGRFALTLATLLLIAAVQLVVREGWPEPGAPEVATMARDRAAFDAQRQAIEKERADVKRMLEREEERRRTALDAGSRSPR